MGLFGRSVQPIVPNRDYVPVAMATTGVYVLQVLTRDGEALRRFSDLDTVLAVPAGSADPTVVRDEVVVDAQGKASRSSKLGLGLSIVGAFVKALGGKGLGPELSTSGAHNLEFSFSDVTEDRVDLASLDAWLALADFDSGSNAVADLLAADQLYVVIGALKAAAITLTLLDEHEQGLAVDVPTIAGAIGGDIEVTAADSSSTTLRFKGSTALTVAAKVAQLKFDERGFWVNERPLGKGEVRGFGAGGEPTYLKPDSGSLKVG